MKRRLLPQSLSKPLLAVPAAALMLGAAQAGTTIGLNFQAWYYDSGTVPQTVGFGQGYQTTGFPVTAKAFGVSAANWNNTDPLDCSSALDTVVTVGSISAHLTAVNMWSGDIGNLVDPDNEWTPGYISSVLPGNDEVTWGYQDNTGWTNTLSGLSTSFPNGYVIGLIGTVKCTPNSRVVVTDGVNASTNAFNSIWTAGNADFNGPVGIMVLPAFSSDSVTFGSVSRNISSAQSCAIGGFIVTDQPVISKDPTNTSVNLSGTLSLSATAFGLPNGLGYQWRQYGTNLPGANSAIYTKVGVTTADAGSYDLVVTNPYGSATSAAATVTVIAVPTITKDLAGTSGTIYSGANFSAWSVTASGGQPLHYTWLKNGTSPVGGNSPVLSLTNLTVADSGDYSVTITNVFGLIKSKTNHLTVVTAQDAYTKEVAADGPIGYWPLNETSGTEAKDYSSYNYIGTNIANVTLGATGPRPPAYQGFSATKTAYQLDGFGAYINFGTGPALVGTTDFTIEAWINTTSTAGGRIIQQRDASGFNGEYMLSVGTDGRVRYELYGGGYQFNLTSANSINDGNWHHIAAVRRNGTNGVLYVDGAVAASANSTTVAPLILLGVCVGGDNRGNDSYFAGSISDVAIYSYGLSASRIGIHVYHGLLGNSGFSFSVVPGGFIADTKPVGTPHSGLNFGSTWADSVTDDSTLITRTGVGVFTGSSQIKVPADPDFDFASGTITFWMRANAPLPGPGSEAAILFDRRTTNGVVIGINDGGSIFWQGQNGSRNEFSGGYVPDNNWHHVAMTFGQTTSDTLSLYIDGTLYASTVVTNGWSWPVGQPIEIGRSHDAYWRAFNGQLDDFRIYSRILTEAEIASVQSSGALVDSAALKLRYNFDTAPVGTSLSWPVGSLQSSPTLGPTAVWTTVTGATSPYPFLPPAPATPSGTSLFYRAGF